MDPFPHRENSSKKSKDSRSAEKVVGDDDEATTVTVAKSALAKEKKVHDSQPTKEKMPHNSKPTTWKTPHVSKPSKEKMGKKLHDTEVTKEKLQHDSEPLREQMLHDPEITRNDSQHSKKGMLPESQPAKEKVLHDSKPPLEKMEKKLHDAEASKEKSQRDSEPLREQMLHDSKRTPSDSQHSKEKMLLESQLAKEKVLHDSKPTLEKEEGGVGNTIGNKDDSKKPQDLEVPAGIGRADSNAQKMAGSTRVFITPRVASVSESPSNGIRVKSKEEAPRAADISAPSEPSSNDIRVKSKEETPRRARSIDSSHGVGEKSKEESPRNASSTPPSNFVGEKSKEAPWIASSALSSNDGERKSPLPVLSMGTPKVSTATSKPGNEDIPSKPLLKEIPASFTQTEGKHPPMLERKQKEYSVISSVCNAVTLFRTMLAVIFTGLLCIFVTLHRVRETLPTKPNPGINWSVISLFLTPLSMATIALMFYQYTSWEKTRLKHERNRSIELNVVKLAFLVLACGLYSWNNVHDLKKKKIESAKRYYIGVRLVVYFLVGVLGVALAKITNKALSHGLPKFKRFQYARKRTKEGWPLPY